MKIKFNGTTRRLIFILPPACYHNMGDDMSEWNYFFNLFTLPGMYE